MIWAVSLFFFVVGFLILTYAHVSMNSRGRAERKLRAAFSHVDRIHAETMRQMEEAASRTYTGWRDWRL